VADPSTTPVSPFNPSAVQVPRDGPGCSKPLLIGCGAMLLLLVVGVVVVRIEAPAIIRWTFRLTEASLTPRLPADATPAERQRLHQAFVAAGRAVGTEQTDLANLQRVQHEIIALSGSQAQLTHQQVRELTEALESLAHRPGSPVPAPAPGLPGGPPPRGAPRRPAPAGSIARAPAPGAATGAPNAAPAGLASLTFAVMAS
jgi:hypothetical protein